MADNRADRFDRADFAARTSKGTALPVASPAPAPAPSVATGTTTPAPKAAISPSPSPVPPPPVSASTSSAPSWRRSELRPDDQIVSIVDSGTPPAAPLTDDARTSLILRDGDSNRVILIDTGPASMPRMAEGTAVPLVQGSPVTLVQGDAVPLAAGQAVPLAQGAAVPATQESSAVSVIKKVLGNPALRKAARSVLSSGNAADVTNQDDGQGSFLTSALGSVLGEFTSSQDGQGDKS